ncbi:MAG: hypothetical protein HY288_12205 [Planctomycetia bacterium]|nr:hypothetical protein [Planctomycetia bacterium]
MLVAAGDWLTIVFPIVFFIIYALNHLISAAKPATPPARKPQRRPPEGERPLRPPQQPPPSPQTSSQSQLNAEIEQFLKRANDRRNDRSRREVAPAARSPKAPPKPPADRPIDVQPLERHEFSSVAASVEKHLSSRTFTQRTEHLADDIVRADEEMEQHLQKAFSHRVGTLSDVQKPTDIQTPATDKETSVVVAAGSAANAIAGLLTDPKNLRQAVILNEILKRPENRW